MDDKNEVIGKADRSVMVGHCLAYAVLMDLSANIQLAASCDLHFCSQLEVK